MSADTRRGGSRSLIVFGASGVAFLALLLAAQPIGDALSARGLSNGAIGALFAVVVAVLLVVPLAFSTRARRRFLADLQSSEKARVESWSSSVGWRPVPAPGEVPAVLDRGRVQSSRVRTATAGEVAGLPSTLTLWEQSFANRGSPVTSTVLWLVLVTDGVPPAAGIGLGTSSGLGVLRKSPIRWAGLPPRALAGRPLTHPWGITRVALWPGPAVPPPAAWGGVAQELEAMLGWILVHDGRLEVAVRLDRGAHPPERLVALAQHTIGVLGGLA